MSQESFIGDLQGLFAAFGQEWSRFWTRHSQDRPERWTAAIQDSHLPAVPEMRLPPITSAQWRAAVRKKKHFSASGLDGWSRADLLLFPEDLLQELLAVYAHAESCGVWPRQALEGLVSALEKRPSASSVGHYRPITVLAMSYRVWSSIRARQCLLHLSQLQVPGLFGNLPRKSASSLWFSVQSRIEACHLLGGTCCGLVADLIKAFNHLPRLPTLAAARKLGIPLGVVRPWTGFLGCLSRRFKIRGSVGPSLLSNAGFPEGCALSCVAMAVVNTSFSFFMAHRSPSVQAMSYVDNWELLSEGPHVLISAIDSLHEFCSRWDLLLDHSKTIVWSSDPEARRVLRAHSLSVKCAARDLGGHVQYSAQWTNFTQVDRLQSLAQRWIRLRESPAPVEQKVRALATAAWPRALRGVSLVHLGPRHFDSLRTNAMKGLWLSKPGASSKIQLSLVDFPTADPGFQALCCSVLDLMCFSCPVQTPQCLDAACTHVGTRAPGPVRVVPERLNAVGTVWDPSCTAFRDCFGIWSPCTSCFSEVKARLVCAWQVAIAAPLQHRAGFAGFASVDPASTRRAAKQYTGEARAFLRVAWNGTFFTQAELFHLGQGETNACHFCGQPDSIKHRLLTCPYFNQERHPRHPSSRTVSFCIVGLLGVLRLFLFLPFW